MRKPLIAGNWKMNLLWDEAMQLMTDVVAMADGSDRCDIALCPPNIYLRHFHEFIRNAQSSVILGAQDCSKHEHGAYTGEVSAAMLKSVGVQYCIIGHSERRQHHRESSDVLSAKVERALEAGIQPIFCCGESDQERSNDEQTFVIENQLDGAVFHLSPELFSKLVIAYEPVWAIGTGKTASPDQAQEMHGFIRGIIQSNYGASVANDIRILYGGSVKPDNAAEIFQQPDVDGGLIGGASLKFDQFRQIIEAA